MQQINEGWGTDIKDRINEIFHRQKPYNAKKFYYLNIVGRLENHTPDEAIQRFNEININVVNNAHLGELSRDNPTELVSSLFESIKLSNNIVFFAEAAPLENKQIINVKNGMSGPFKLNFPTSISDDYVLFDNKSFPLSSIGLSYDSFNGTLVGTVSTYNIGNAAGYVFTSNKGFNKLELTISITAPPSPPSPPVAPEEDEDKDPNPDGVDTLKKCGILTQGEPYDIIEEQMILGIMKVEFTNSIKSYSSIGGGISTYDIATLFKEIVGHKKGGLSIDSPKYKEVIENADAGHSAAYYKRKLAHSGRNVVPSENELKNIHNYIHGKYIEKGIIVYKTPDEYKIMKPFVSRATNLLSSIWKRAAQLGSGDITAIPGTAKDVWQTFQNTKQ